MGKTFTPGAVGNEATGTAYQPAFAQHATGATHPFVDVSPPFVLVFNPIRWTVLCGRLIPSLHKVTLEPGCNGISMVRGGRVMFGAARTKITEEGRTVIPYEWGPNGESYVQKVETRPNGGQGVRDTYLYAWEMAALGDAQVHVDEDGYAEWCESLVTAGRIPSCPPYVAKRMTARVAAKLEEEEARAAKGGDGSGAAKIRARALRAQLDVLTQAVSKIQPKPKRGKPAAVRLDDDGAPE